MVHGRRLCTVNAEENLHAWPNNRSNRHRRYNTDSPLANQGERSRFRGPRIGGNFDKRDDLPGPTGIEVRLATDEHGLTQIRDNPSTMRDHNPVSAVLNAVRVLAESRPVAVFTMADHRERLKRSGILCLICTRTRQPIDRTTSVSANKGLEDLLVSGMLICPRKLGLRQGLDDYALVGGRAGDGAADQPRRELAAQTDGTGLEESVTQSSAASVSRKAPSRPRVNE